VSLGDGAQVKNSVAGGGIEVDFLDGKILTAIPSGSYDSMKYLNVQFEKTGLLSDGDGPAESGIAGAVPEGSWLPALPTGASLGAMPATSHERYVTLYSTFGNAWRVTSKNTLFDYAPGTSTATFTNTRWPVENAKTCTIPNQTVLKPVSAAVAEEACKSVSDAKLHASCLFDVQATGDTGFTDTYQASENAHKILSVKPIDASKLVVPEAK
jgi:lysyl endopeptidase